MNLSLSLLPQLGWSIALGPWKQLPLNVFVLWMAGNTISLFPIMMVGMMLVRPVQTLFGYKEGERGRGKERERVMSYHNNIILIDIHHLCTRIHMHVVLL